MRYHLITSFDVCLKISSVLISNKCCLFISCHHREHFYRMLGTRLIALKNKKKIQKEINLCTMPLRFKLIPFHREKKFDPIFMLCKNSVYLQFGVISDSNEPRTYSNKVYLMTIFKFKSNKHFKIWTYILICYIHNWRVFACCFAVGRRATCWYYLMNALLIR